MGALLGATGVAVGCLVVAAVRAWCGMSGASQATAVTVDAGPLSYAYAIVLEAEAHDLRADAGPMQRRAVRLALQDEVQCCYAGLFILAAFHFPSQWI